MHGFLKEMSCSNTISYSLFDHVMWKDNYGWAAVSHEVEVHRYLLHYVRTNRGNNYWVDMNKMINDEN